MKYYAIIVGGGLGSRMQADIPKQFMLLNGRPVLMYTIEAFYHSEFKPEIIVVLNIDFHPYWEQLCKQYNFSIPHQLVKGGRHRFHSVKNGIKAIKGKAIIAIHDAVRPLLSEKLIKRSYQEAELWGNAVVAIKSRDSVRQQSGKNSIPLNRENIYLVQTPQTFSSDILRKAYKQEFRNEFTDDASVAEHSGVAIKLIEGENKNFKITFPEDIRIAELYLNQES
ncbi:MAG: 2-C-methyl-D-erythritol 4-phosphate cytidylyltransferase [Pedobacter sp.]